jgi:protein O-mannosyl-transferase
LVARHGWRLLAVWALVLAAYSNSFEGALVFDSASIVGQDPRIRQVTLASVESILTGGYWHATPTAGLYRPLTTLSYLLNYSVLGDGPRPAGYHWLNLLLHEANVGLVYALGVLLFGAAAPALAVAALWGAHPLLTESVTNVVGRSDLLAAFGVLAGLLCHARGASAAGRRRAAWLAGLAGAATVGIFSKESAAVLPVLMLLYDVRPRRVTPYAVVVLPLVAFLLMRLGLGLHMRIELADNPLAGAGFWTTRLTALKVVGQYARLFLWPAHLSADYSYHAVPLFGWRLSDWEILLAGSLIAVGAAARRNRTILFFLAFFLVALAPVSNLLIEIGSIMAERFLYLPSVGLAGGVVAAVYTMGRRRSIAWAAIGLVCLVFTARTYARNVDWQDALSLWSSAVRVCPESARAHYNLAKQLERLPGRLPEAIAEYRQAIRIEPDRADAHDNLANALSAVPGGLAEAIEEYRAALRIAPAAAAVHNDLANVLARTPGRVAEAIAEYRAALLIVPRNAETHYNLGNALAPMQGHLPEAIAEYRAALEIQPDHADAHNNLGYALSVIPGKSDEAVAEYRAALRLQPGLVAAHVNLGNALFGMPGRLDEAIAEYQTALRIHPDNAEAHQNLGIAFANIGRMREAVTELETALRIRPDPDVRQTLERVRAASR